MILQGDVCVNGGSILVIQLGFPHSPDKDLIWFKSGKKRLLMFIHHEWHESCFGTGETTFMTFMMEF
jgi:hypothetical protein